MEVNSRARPERSDPCMTNQTTGPSYYLLPTSYLMSLDDPTRPYPATMRVAVFSMSGRYSLQLSEHYNKKIVAGGLTDWGIPLSERDFDMRRKQRLVIDSAPVPAQRLLMPPMTNPTEELPAYNYDNMSYHILENGDLVALYHTFIDAAAFIFVRATAYDADGNHHREASIRYGDLFNGKPELRPATQVSQTKFQNRLLLNRQNAEKVVAKAEAQPARSLSSRHFMLFSDGNLVKTVAYFEYARLRWIVDHAIVTNPAGADETLDAEQYYQFSVRYRTQDMVELTEHGYWNARLGRRIPAPAPSVKISDEIRVTTTHLGKPDVITSTAADLPDEHEQSRPCGCAGPCECAAAAEKVCKGSADCTCENWTTITVETKTGLVYINGEVFKGQLETFTLDTDTKKANTVTLTLDVHELVLL